MPINQDFLTLTQWLSPAFPMGGFAFSHGVEAAIAQGWIGDEAGLIDYLTDVITCGTGRNDAIWIGLGAQCADGAELVALEQEAAAWQVAPERLREARLQGAAFAAQMRQVWGMADAPDVMLPLVLGYASGQRDLSLGDVAALYLQGFATNLVLAAQRLMPLGQTGAQRVLRALSPACLEAAQGALSPARTGLWSCAFVSDIAAMRHETLSPRMFQS